MNFNVKNDIIMIIIMMMTMCELAGCKLSPTTTYRDEGKKNNLRTIGTVRELKRTLGNFFGKCWKE